MNLNGQERKEIQRALIDAFPNTASLEQMLSFGLDKNLDTIAKGDNLEYIVFQLITRAISEGWIKELISAAYESNNENPSLKSIAAKFLENHHQKLFTDNPIGEPKLEAETIEREFKYLVNQENFEQIENFIRTTKSVSQYKLEEATEVVNHDYYFDTRDQQLFNKKASLRFRIILKNNQEEFIITLKSEHKQKDNTIDKELHQRLETEGYPNIETLKKVQRKLRELGLLNSDISDISDSEDFRILYNGLQGIFLLWNFEEFFHLKNKRISRTITDLGNKIAEITFDKVDLKIDNQDFTFYEIELEAKVNGETKKLSDIAQFLKEKFPEQLTPSQESKYERGLKFLRTIGNDKFETKLIVPNKSVNDLLESLKSLSTKTIKGYNLEKGIKGTITDTYYDTKNKDLLKNKWYLRIRDKGKGQKVVILRQNSLTDLQEIPDKPMTKRSEIKGSINQDSLTKVIDSLIKSKFISEKKINNNVVSNFNIEDFFKSYGLEEVVKIQTERVTFPIYDEEECLGSIKYDVVKFIFSNLNKIFDLKLIEVSTSNTNKITVIELIKYYLMFYLKEKGFELKESNEPKYKIGLDLLKDYQIEQNKLVERKLFPSFFPTQIKNLSLAQQIVLICITFLTFMIIGLTITAVPLS